MKPAKVRFSDAAIDDIMKQAEWYEQRTGHILANRWESAVSSAVIRIVANPRSGSPCAFKANELQSTRRMTIKRFPKHLIFYQFENCEIVILRVIHGARDLESLF